MASVTNAHIMKELDDLRGEFTKLCNTITQNQVDEMVCRNRVGMAISDIQQHKDTLYGNGKEGITTTVQVMKQEITTIHSEVKNLRNTNRVIVLGIVALLIETVIKSIIGGV